MRLNETCLWKRRRPPSKYLGLCLSNGKKSMAKSTWTFGYPPDNFQLYISREPWNWRKNYGKAYVLGLESKPLGSQYSSSCFSAKILVETSPRTISWIFSFLGTFLNNLVLSYSKTLRLCHLLTNVQIPRLTPFLNVLWIPEWCCWQWALLVHRVTKERVVSAGILLTGSQLLLSIQEWFQAEVSTFWAGSVPLWGKNH